ncbi:MAG: penicillin-binding protein activator LpoB [Puniceicoccales bacterium]|jgi:hypothetical protein|nr:penicillin-binding protein activator LpoB [Puniceicoccales bacterium]
MRKLFLLSLSTLFVGCGSVKVSAPPDLNESKTAAVTIINDLVTHNSVSAFTKQNTRKPRIGLGRIRNNTRHSGFHQTLDAEQVTLGVREALLASGQVEVVDDKDPKASPADYYLEGEIKAADIVVKDDERERRFSFALWISSASSGSVVWQKTADVKGSFVEL